MDEIYGLHSAIGYSSAEGSAGMGSSLPPESLIAAAGDYLSSYVFNRDKIGGSGGAAAGGGMEQLAELPPATGENSISEVYGQEVATSIKAKIATHPRYPTLLEAYIECQKVGAPPEIANLLEEIRRENHNYACNSNSVTGCLGADPELDQFMESYCEVLVKYKSDLAKPFDEATTFLNKIEMQLNNLCSGSSRTCASDELAGSSDDELSGGEIDLQETRSRGEDRELKDKLLRKYSGYLSSLKQEFSKKKKKGKLPKEARQTLLDWWNIHYKWPYPTESDKIALAESTGLDQKQINNWFINQRKRHWKPSENMQFAVMDTLSAPFYVDH
ncbi:hypothetical protein AMTRI_Chr03g141380 [Amborella trichopoda]|uniref:Uncharacterized protein n=1 Tax=Amborella trichopoda TaxID=13333 RepID=W1P515_AMBTC|nr:homeobox protein knotted-1-like 2 isoform X2 [Amborella trichopoda]ERN02729.1 hypothetical protein AMTR_s00085p00165180 [Amborella trichopoda]|eukprot:XP_006841054.1 homeobox protein knotted-1-like 2 isoform X2 [Amborella trichopoda]